MKHRIFSFSLLFVSATMSHTNGVLAQANASPYSMIGIGDLNYNPFDRSSGMGGAGLSLSSGRYLLTANPASIATLDNNYFTGELGVNYKAVYYANQYKADGTQLNSKDLQFERLAFGVKPTKHWGTSFGLRQFSNVNFSYEGEKEVQNDNTIVIPTKVTGSGGLNQVYWSNAVRLGRHFSVGIESSYLFGSREETQTMEATSVSSQYNIPLTVYYNHLYFKGGVQYHGNIAKDLQLGLGAVAANKTKLNGRQSLDMTEGNANDGTVLTTVIKDMTLANSYYRLPVTLGGGLSLKYKNKYTFAADYQQQDWNGANNISQFGAQTVNSKRWSGGFEYANMRSEVVNGMLYSYEKSFFQLGGYYNQGYMQVRGQQINDYAITFGIGFNPKYAATSLGSQLGYLFNFSVGTRGTTKENLIKENYYQIGVILSYRDFWRSAKSGVYN